MTNRNSTAVNIKESLLYYVCRIKALSNTFNWVSGPYNPFCLKLGKILRLFHLYKTIHHLCMHYSSVRDKYSGAVHDRTF